MAQYLTAHGAIAEGAAETDMESAVIGAKTGRKYVFSYEGNNKDVYKRQGLQVALHMGGP